MPLPVLGSYHHCIITMFYHDSMTLKDDFSSIIIYYYVEVLDALC